MVKNNKKPKYCENSNMFSGFFFELYANVRVIFFLTNKNQINFHKIVSIRKFEQKFLGAISSYSLQSFLFLKKKKKRMGSFHVKIITVRIIIYISYSKERRKGREERTKSSIKHHHSKQTETTAKENRFLISTSHN